MPDNPSISTTPTSHEPAQAGSDVDVQRLADLVYRLLARDIRLGLARGEDIPAQRPW